MRILFVCAGNIMRSVIAERVFETRAEEILGDSAAALEVESGGISAEDETAPHPDCLRALEKLGIEGRETTSTRTDDEQLQRCDLVLTMTRQQSYIMASDFPEHRGKIFSVIEINGAIETILDQMGASVGGDDWRASGGLSEPELGEAAARAVDILRSAPRERMRPLAGVPMTIRELMTMFTPCFNQVSGIHDPLGGTAEEVERCAKQIEREVTAFLKGLLTLAITLRGSGLES